MFWRTDVRMKGSVEVLGKYQHRLRLPKKSLPNQRVFVSSYKVNLNTHEPVVN